MKDTLDLNSGDLIEVFLFSEIEIAVGLNEHSWGGGGHQKLCTVFRLILHKMTFVKNLVIKYDATPVKCVVLLEMFQFSLDHFGPLYGDSLTIDPCGSR